MRGFWHAYRLRWCPGAASPRPASPAGHGVPPWYGTRPSGERVVMGLQTRPPLRPALSRRLAAFVALAAPVAAASAAVESTVAHPGDLFLLVVSIAVATVAA